MYTIGQFAKKTGVTIRTLHYYDEIGLLPAIIEQNGRRFYNDNHIQTIQTILVCKYLDYTLEEIKAVIDNHTSFKKALYEQREQLENKRKQLNQMIASLDLAIEIHEKTDQVEPMSLLVIIHSLLTVEQQKQYLKQFLSEDLIDMLYDYFDQNFVELNRRYITLSYQLKEACQQPPKDEELKQLILQFLGIIPLEMSLALTEELTEQDVENMDKWLFTSLFSEAEEYWLEQQMERLNIKEELLNEDANTTAVDPDQS